MTHENPIDGLSRAFAALLDALGLVVRGLVVVAASLAAALLVHGLRSAGFVGREAVPWFRRPASRWAVLLSMLAVLAASVVTARVLAPSQEPTPPPAIAAPTPGPARPRETIGDTLEADELLQPDAYPSAWPSPAPTGWADPEALVPREALLWPPEPPSWWTGPLLPYWSTVVSAAEELGYDHVFLAAVIVQENPQAEADIVTFDGGHGIGQIQAATAQLIQAGSGLPCVDGWADPTTSIRCAAWYLKGALDDGADLGRPGDPEPVLLAGVIGYNSGHGSNIVHALRRSLQAGAADPCAAIGNQYSSQYCYRTRDRWSVWLSERGS